MRWVEGGRELSVESVTDVASDADRLEFRFADSRELLFALSKYEDRSGVYLICPGEVEIGLVLRAVEYAAEHL
jgi:hypothetical protein